MSESYLTHIKNGTRRWNEDSLRKLAQAFEISPIDLFAERRQRTDDIDSNVSMPEKSDSRIASYKLFLLLEKFLQIHLHTTTN